MATVSGEKYPNTCCRLSSPSRTFSRRIDKTADGRVSEALAAPPERVHQSDSQQRTATSVTRTYDAAVSKLPGSSLKNDFPEKEVEDLHGFSGLASALLRDVSGWLTEQFIPFPHPVAPTPPPSKTKTDIAAAEHSKLPALPERSGCSTTLARHTLAKSAVSDSTSCSSSLTHKERQCDHERQESGSSLNKFLQNERCRLEWEKTDVRAESASSTRATSHSHVNSYSGFTGTNKPSTMSLSVREQSRSHDDVVHSDKSSFVIKNVEGVAERLSATENLREVKTTCTHQNASLKKEASAVSVYEASYPGVPRWEKNSEPAAEHHHKDCFSPTGRKKEKSSLTIMSTTMKPCKTGNSLDLQHNKFAPLSQRERRDTGVLSRCTDFCRADLTEKTAVLNDTLQDRNSSCCKRGAAASIDSLPNSVDGLPLYPSPRTKDVEKSTHPGTTSFLSSFTTSFRENFEAATRSRGKAQKNAVNSINLSSSSVTEETRTGPAVLAQGNEAKEICRKPEFEVSGDWSFKPDALFASFMSIFDGEEDVDSRERGSVAGISPAASPGMPGSASNYTGGIAENHKHLRSSSADALSQKLEGKQQQRWASGVSRNGVSAGESFVQNVSASIRKAFSGESKSLEDVMSSSGSCAGSLPTRTFSLSCVATPSLNVRTAADTGAAHVGAVRREITAIPAGGASRRLARRETVTTDASLLLDSAESWFGGEEVSPRELEEPADGMTHPQTWMDDAAAYTLRCVTRSHIEVSVLHLHNIGKIVDASLTSGRAQYVYIQSNNEERLRCPGFNMLHLRVPFSEPETQVITLEFTTRISRSHFSLLHTLSRLHKNRLLLQQQHLPQQQLPHEQLRQQQLPRQRLRQQHHYLGELTASMEDPRWRRLLRQLRWHRRIDEDRKKDAEIKRYRVDIPVSTLNTKGSLRDHPTLQRRMDGCSWMCINAHEQQMMRCLLAGDSDIIVAADAQSRWILLEVDNGSVTTENSTAAYLAQTEEEAKMSIYSPRLYISLHKRMSGLLHVPRISAETATTYKRPESATFAGKVIYVGWFDDPIDVAVADTLNSHSEVLSLNKSICRLEKGRYEIDGFECRVFLSNEKKKCASLSTGDEKEKSGSERKEEERKKKKTPHKMKKQEKTCETERPATREEEEEEEEEEKKQVDKERKGETKDAEKDESEELIPLVEEDYTVQPLIDYLKGTLDNITWTTPSPSSCIEMIPPKYLPPLHTTLVPWEARVERRKAMELACHRAAIREQVAAELLRLQKRPVPPLLHAKHVNPVLLRPAPDAAPALMTYTWKEEYSDVQIVILDNAPAERGGASPLLQQQLQPQRPQNCHTHQQQQHVHRQQHQYIHQQQQYMHQRQQYLSPQQQYLHQQQPYQQYLSPQQLHLHQQQQYLHPQQQYVNPQQQYVLQQQQQYFQRQPYTQQQYLQKQYIQQYLQQQYLRQQQDVQQQQQQYTQQQQQQPNVYASLQCVVQQHGECPSSNGEQKKANNSVEQPQHKLLQLQQVAAPRLQQQAVSPRQHQQVASPRLQHQQVASPRLQHQQVASPRLQHQQVASPRLQHQQVASPRLQQQQQQPRCMQQQGKNLSYAHN